MHINDIISAVKILDNWANDNNKSINLFGIDCQNDRPLPLKDMITRLEKMLKM